MLHAMEAYAGMQNDNAQEVNRQPNQSDQQAQEQHTQDHQLVHRRRVMMQEEVMLADRSGLEAVNNALVNVEVRAQHHAAEMENQMKCFMNTTCGAFADIERKLQRHLEEAIQAAQSESLVTATITARDFRDYVACNDERVGQVRQQLKASLDTYEEKSRATQQFTVAAQTQAWQEQLSDTLAATHQWLETSVCTETDARVFQTQTTLQQEILSAQEDAKGRVRELESRMQLKLDDAIKTSARSFNGVLKLVDDATQTFVYIVDAKVQATENNFRNIFDNEAAKLENKMQAALEAAIVTAEYRTAEQQQSLDVRLRTSLAAIEAQVQNGITSGMVNSVSELEQRMNDLLQATSPPLSAATAKQVADGISKAEARILHTQQLLHRKVSTQQTLALRSFETHLRENLRKSRTTEAEKPKVAMKIMEQQIEKRLTTAMSHEFGNEVQTVTKSSTTVINQHVAENQLPVTDQLAVEEPNTASDAATEIVLSGKTGIASGEGLYDVDATPPSTPPNAAATVRSDTCQRVPRVKGQIQPKKQHHDVTTNKVLTRKRAPKAKPAARSSLERARVAAMRDLASRVEARINGGIKRDRGSLKH